MTMEMSPIDPEPLVERIARVPDNEDWRPHVAKVHGILEALQRPVPVAERNWLGALYDEGPPPPVANLTLYLAIMRPREHRQNAFQTIYWTCFETGRDWRFSQRHIGDWRFGHNYIQDVPISIAVAASAAIPYMAGFVKLTIDPTGWLGIDSATRGGRGTSARGRRQ